VKQTSEYQEIVEEVEKLMKPKKLHTGRHQKTHNNNNIDRLENIHSSNNSETPKKRKTPDCETVSGDEIPDLTQQFPKKPKL
jgi:hypothetical protein